MVTKGIRRTKPDERAIDRRREPRLAADTPVMVTVLGDLKQPPIPGRVEDMSGSALRLRVPLPIKYGAPLKVEGNDMLLLGEVCRSQPDRDGYQVAMQISHSLNSLSELDRFNRALFGKSPPVDSVASIVADDEEGSVSHAYERIPVKIR